MSRNQQVIVAAILSAAIAAGVVLWSRTWTTRTDGAAAQPLTSTPPPAPTAAPAASTIEASGEILGIAIGSPMQQAREKLDPLREAGMPYIPDAKEKEGRRILWRLKETEFAWIMAWADPEGKITRVRAMLRPDRAKPFAEIGDAKTAVSATPNTIRWNLRDRTGAYYRLIAQGPEEKATTVYMFSLEEPVKERTIRLEESSPEEE